MVQNRPTRVPEIVIIFGVDLGLFFGLILPAAGTQNCAPDAISGALGLPWAPWDLLCAPEVNPRGYKRIPGLDVVRFWIQYWLI